ncbi:MAG: hypothetical protein KZQ73_00795 [Candidatus Thiodiazotropha sp. (ex Semelilucina semeliformis)]|nr:hypothetical protein [Candidatus Thiodiazotropha sp. (ex Semelilucina semeliformis)]
MKYNNSREAGMNKMKNQCNVRSTVPSDGDPFEDRIEFFRKPSKMQTEIIDPYPIPTLCNVGNDLGYPLLEPGKGVIFRIITRLANWLRMHSD